VGFLRRKFFKRALVGAPLALGGAVAEAALVEPEWLKVKRIKVREGGCRIAHFTDVHFKGDSAYLKRVVEVINSLAPEIVCFTGDLVEEAEFFQPALDILKGIKAPLYGIP
jgi:uncharacterized protein